MLLYSITAGCGYRFTSIGTLPADQAEGPYQSALESGGCLITTIGINNKTMVPGLEDRLRYILSEELVKRGCSINNGVPKKSSDFLGLSKDGISIYGSITDFNMSIVAERSNQIALYEIIIRTDFRLIMPDGKELSKTFSSPFITDFKSGSRIEDIIMARDREIDKVMKDIALEVIYTIGMYGWER
ncbi:MAG: LPS assembly lipoprotein LptE [Thermodesulfovibrionales bacterium]